MISKIVYTAMHDETSSYVPIIITLAGITLANLGASPIVNNPCKPYSDRITLIARTVVYTFATLTLSTDFIRS